MKNLRLLILTLSISIASCSDDDGSQNSVYNGGSNSSGCAGGPSTVTDIDGNVYNVVTIGNQCWMKENLKTTRYRNGTPITYAFCDSTFSVSINGGVCDYSFDQTNSSIYGKLYNYYAVANPAGLCPTGWHVPSNSEYIDLFNAVGGQYQIAGAALKATGSLHSNTGLWHYAGYPGNNSSGFTGLPGGAQGYVDYTIPCDTDSIDLSGGLNYWGYWWTSTDSLDFAFIMELPYNTPFASDYWEEKPMGYSVRCIRD
jgi:uncharacterized protein (TIGR02145 family)